MARRLSRCIISSAFTCSENAQDDDTCDLFDKISGLKTVHRQHGRVMCLQMATVSDRYSD